LIFRFTHLPVEECHLVGDFAVFLLLRSRAVAGIGIDQQENWSTT
jgi:hypothetical protein